MIDYNGDPFVDQPVPYVTISTDYVYDGDQRIERLVMNLRGELLSCSKAELEALRAALALKFKTRQDITITGMGTYEVENVISINFGDSPLFTKLPYTISLQLKDSSSLIEKSVQVSFQESKDASLTIVRTISAGGKNASDSVSTAWANCKAFVSQEAVKAPPKPILIDSKGYNYFLVSVDEEFDRVNCKATLTQTYRCDLYYNFKCVARRRVNIERSATGTIVRLEGDAEFKKDDTVAYLEARTAIASLMLLPVFAAPLELTAMKISNRSFDIDKQGGRASFSIEFRSLDDILFEDYSLGYSITLEEGSDTSLIKVNINGIFEIKGEVTLAKRNAIDSKFTEYVINNNYLYAKCNAIYSEFFPIGTGTITLKNIPIASQYSKSKDGTKITWTASFDDRFLLDGTNYYNYTLGIAPAINKISFSPSLKGGFHFIDLNYKNRANAELSSETINCGEDLDYNLDSLAEFYLRKHIETDIDPASNSKVIIKAKSRSADNNKNYSSSISATYDGVEFAI